LERKEKRLASKKYERGKNTWGKALSLGGKKKRLPVIQEEGKRGGAKKDISCQ